MIKVCAPKERCIKNYTQEGNNKIKPLDILQFLCIFFSKMKIKFTKNASKRYVTRTVALYICLCITLLIMPGACLNEM